MEEKSGGDDDVSAFSELEKKAESNADYAAKGSLGKSDRRLKKQMALLRGKSLVARFCFLLVLPPLLFLALSAILDKSFFPKILTYLWVFFVIVWIILCICMRILVRCKKRGKPSKKLTFAVRQVKPFFYFLNITEPEAVDADERVQGLKTSIKQDWFIFIICVVTLLDMAVFSAYDNWTAPFSLLLLQGLGLFVLSDRMDMPKTHEFLDKVINGMAGRIGGKN